MLKMKKKIRDLTTEELHSICLKQTSCEKCSIKRIYHITVESLLELVQKDELNVLLNQEVEVEE